MANRYCVHILTTQNNTTRYAWMTNNLSCRVSQHKAGRGGSFTKRYALTKLVY